MSKKHTSYLSDIKRRISGAGKLPWKLEMKTVRTQFGVKELPVAINSPSRPVVAEYDGLLYGYSPDNEMEVKKHVSFLVNSRLDIEALLRAVMIACAEDETKAEFILDYARKEVLQHHKLIPEEATLYRED
jgi:hypothetical protein